MFNLSKKPKKNKKDSKQRYIQQSLDVLAELGIHPYKSETKKDMNGNDQIIHWVTDETMQQIVDRYVDEGKDTPGYFISVGQGNHNNYPCYTVCFGYNECYVEDFYSLDVAYKYFLTDTDTDTLYEMDKKFMGRLH